ncbi:hypothetical protein [Aeromonas veronii]|uniref:hypothetical protein n=1 Tax=Aeromonas veronii TaxID=654 RepID=UPI002444C4F9|nr:hypothetical protein [Aeromonas veronii]
MAKNITIKVPGKHPRTGEITTFELKGQRIDIGIGGQAVPFLIHGRGDRNVPHSHPERIPHRPARWLAHRSLRNT